MSDIPFVNQLGDESNAPRSGLCFARTAAAAAAGSGCSQSQAPCS
jgi:hypothetical protein